MSEKSNKISISLGPSKDVVIKNMVMVGDNTGIEIDSVEGGSFENIVHVKPPKSADFTEVMNAVMRLRDPKLEQDLAAVKKNPNNNPKSWRRLVDKIGSPVARLGLKIITGVAREAFEDYLKSKGIAV